MGRCRKAERLEGLLDIVGQMATLFAIVGVGYVAKRTGFMTKSFDEMLSKLILNIAIPGLIIGSVLVAENLPSLQHILVAFALSCVSYFVVIAIAFAVTFALRVHAGNRGVFRFMLCFGNVGFIGFPVLSAIFGSEVLIYATIFNLPFNVLVFTVGIWFLKQDSEREADEGAGSSTTWRTFLTPAIVSCAVAIVLALLGIHDVPVIGGAFSTLGSLTTPGALLIIGSSLANMPARDLIGGPKLWTAALFRLALIPLCVWSVFHFLIADPLMLGAIVVISGMPVATNGTMLCYEYGGNARAMAQGTFMTTVFSLISIPLLVQFVRLVG